MLSYFFRMAVLGAAVFSFWYGTKWGITLTSKSLFWSSRHGINLAYFGTVLSLLSVFYMFRKYRIVTWGKLRHWLNVHVLLGAVGIFLIFLHANFALGAIVPAYDVWAMIIIGISGLFGWHIYLTSAKDLLNEVAVLEEKDEIILSTMTSSAFKFWHDTHFILTLAAFVLTVVHVATIFIYRGRY